MLMYQLMNLRTVPHLPVKMFISDDFPDPEGPMIAVNFPDSNFPEMHLRMVLNPRSMKTMAVNVIIFCNF